MVERFRVDHKPFAPELDEQLLSVSCHELEAQPYPTPEDFYFSKQTPAEEVFDKFDSLYEFGSPARASNYSLLLSVCARASREAMTLNGRASEQLHGTAAHSMYTALQKRLAAPFIYNAGGHPVIDKDFAEISESLYPKYSRQAMERRIRGTPTPQQFRTDLLAVDDMRRKHFQGKKLEPDEKAIVYVFDKVIRGATEQRFLRETEQFRSKEEHIPEGMYETETLVLFLEPHYWRNQDIVIPGKQRAGTTHKCDLAWLAGEYDHAMIYASL